MGERGQTIIEYILVIALVSIVIIWAVAAQGEGTIYEGLRRAAERAGATIMNLVGG